MTSHSNSPGQERSRPIPVRESGSSPSTSGSGGAVATASSQEAAQGQAGSAGDGDASGKGAGRNVRVLVVDDHEDSAELLLELLSGRACEARSASDATSALLIAQEFVPDVALLDIGLPDMDGYELGQKLRQIPKLQGLTMVALTGYSGHAEQARAREAGFHAHVEKPVDMAQLFKLLDRLGAPLITEA